MGLGEDVATPAWSFPRPGQAKKGEKGGYP